MKLAQHHQQIQFTYEDHPPFCFAAQAGDVEELPFCSVAEADALSESSKAYWSNTGKMLPKRVGTRTQPSFTPLRNGKASEVTPLKHTVLCISSWKEVTMLYRLGGQPCPRCLGGKYRNSCCNRCDYPYSCRRSILLWRM